VTRVLALGLLACGACNAAGSAAPPQAQPPSAAPAGPAAAPEPQSKRSLQTTGTPYDLKLEADRVTFCDDRGARTLDLSTGSEGAAQRSCTKSAEMNGACEGLSLDATVSSPDLGNDVVQVTGVVTPFRLKGHIADCQANGKVLVVATHSQVLTIDATREAVQVLSEEGAEQVVIDGKWVAWLAGSRVQVRAR
jgi:hypothetical protein